MKTILFSAIAALLLIISSFLINSEQQTPTFFPGDYGYLQRCYPLGYVPQEEYKKALQQAAIKKQQGSRAFNLVWEFVGSTNIGGRITDVEMHSSDQQTIYAAAASGGIFKSTDAGTTWLPIFDKVDNLSIGDFAIAPSDPNTIYVGTGESNGGGGSMAYDGIGVFKSTDAGATWNAAGLENIGNTGKVIIHPTDPNTVYVAAMGALFGNDNDRGIYKTTDGGSNWQQVLFVSDSTGGADIVIHPTNPDTLYAAMWQRIRRPHYRTYGGSTSGIYRSYDGGNTWAELTSGLPSPSSTEAGRIGLDISQSNPNILYTTYTDSIGYFKGIYKTENNGDSWTATSSGGISNMYSSYGWWNGKINIDPTDPNIVFVGGLDLFRTTNGGNNWSNVSGSMHVDQHGVYIHLANANLVLCANDGGVYISQNGGSNWNKVNGLPITQFYTCERDLQQPDRLYGGTQDNGTNRTLTGDLDDWNRIYGGDGFRVLVDPTNNTYVYAESQYGNIGRSTNGGNTFFPATTGISGGDRKNWNTPIAISNWNTDVLYTGTHRVYKSTNRANNWSAISPDLTDGNGSGNLVYHSITSIGLSNLDSNIIWVGTDDGNVQLSTDGGSNWNNVTNGLPKRWITSVVADNLDSLSAYVTLSGYRHNEFLSHIFKTTDGGQSWIDISGDLPEAPANDIIPDPEVATNLYLATDVGVYLTIDGGNTWEILADSMPNVVVTDLHFNPTTRRLLAGTYGRSMYETTIPLNVGIKETEAIGVAKVYPNPANDFFTFSFFLQDTQHGEVIITDITGKTVYRKQVSRFTQGNNIIQLPTTNLQQGNYIVSFVGTKNQLNSKLIITK